MVKGAVVGVGYLGSFHTEKWKALEKENPQYVSLDYVFDANIDQAKLISDKLNVKWVSKVEDLIGRINAVTIATSTPSHYELAKLFLKNGVHVLVEKPMSLSSKECHELCLLAHSRNLSLAVGHSERYNPAFKHFLEIEKGSEFIEMKRWAPFKIRGSDVSVIHDLLIHDLDLLIALSSDELNIRYVDVGSMMTSLEDWISIGILTRNRQGKKLKAHISIGRVYPEMQRSFVSYSAEQTVLSDLQNVEIKICKKEHDIMKTEVIKLEKKDHLYLETKNFINSILNNEKINVSGDHGYKAALVIDRIYEFIKNNNE